MKRNPRLAHLYVAAAFLPLVAGCPLSVNSNEIAVTYDPDPQHFMQDFGNQTGTLQDVPCAGNPSLCSAVPAPMGTTATCDSATQKCILTAQLAAAQTVTLANESGFPSSVANAAVSNVEVRVMRYWTPTNTLTFDTPPIDVYVGPQGATKPGDAGVTKLGTMPPLTKMTQTMCRAGAAGTKDSYCEMPLTPDGKMALSLLAKNYKTPFTILVAGTLTARGGQPMPAGKLEMNVQPQLVFSIPLK